MVTERLRRAWAAWRSVPGVVHRVHELAAELVGLVPELKLAMRENLRGLTEVAGSVQSLRLDLERARIATAYPVTVSFLGRISHGRDFYPTGPKMTVYGQIAAAEALAAVPEPPLPIIGAKTVMLAPGERCSLTFIPQRRLEAEALIWVSGPAVLEQVIMGRDVLAPCCDGFGIAAITRRSLVVGEALDCRLVGVGARAFAAGEPRELCRG